MTDSSQQGLQGSGASRHPSSEGEGRGAESRLDGRADGISDSMDICEPDYLTTDYWQEEPEGTPRVTQEKEQRVERIKRLGNAVVPLQAKTAFEYLFFG